ncbi:MAG: hypothetical protein HXX11_04900 [Desulfuromonadales bacterium]|nr:hypothetical protein [Desulfuromonadales bacterium]
MDVTSLFLSPPIAFVLLLIAAVVDFWLLGILITKGTDRIGKAKPYACGEDVDHHRLQPDYGQFFSFAFFFTIMHVVAMIIATVPSGSVPDSLFAAFFTLSAASGLTALFRKEV